MNDVSDVKFPFALVDTMETATGRIPNYMAVVTGCPHDFFEGNEWTVAAQQMIDKRPTVKQWVKIMNERRETSVTTVLMQHLYVETWLESWMPPAHVKVAVVGWLLSLMLKQPPTLPSE